MINGGYKNMKDLTTMNLADTAEMMNSGDYKDRFRAEFYQTVMEGVEL